MAKKLQILRGTTAQNDAYTGSIGELTMDTEKVEVRIHDGTTQGGKAIGSGGSASLPILIHVFSDHKLNDISWLNADTFSWQSGDMYIAAYEHLLNDYNSLSTTSVLYAWTNTAGDETYYTKTSTPSVGDQLFDATGMPAIVSNAYVNGKISVVFVYADGSITYARTDPDAMLSRDTSKDVTLSAPASETETIGSTTIIFYRADDGHKICLPDQEDALMELYNKTGVAWYYILDTENKQFKLPRINPDLEESAYQISVLGDGDYLRFMSSDDSYKGSYINSRSETLGSVTGWLRTLNSEGGLVDLGNMKLSDVKGQSGIKVEKDTIFSGKKYLYFYVGNFERDAMEQTAGIAAETFNSKADSDLGNVPANYDYVVESQIPTAENSYTWYRKYKSGWVEQGGRYANQSFTGGQATFTATLPIPVVGSNIIASPEYVSGDSVVVVTSWSTGTTANTTVERNTISSTLSTEASARWIVFGNAQ